jgi:hypothetical protein
MNWRLRGRQKWHTWLLDPISHCTLESHNDRSWLAITIESDSEAEKFDIHWERPNSKRVVQVKT